MGCVKFFIRTLPYEKFPPFGAVDPHDDLSLLKKKWVQLLSHTRICTNKRSVNLHSLMGEDIPHLQGEMFLESPALSFCYHLDLQR